MIYQKHVVLSKFVAHDSVELLLIINHIAMMCILIHSFPGCAAFYSVSKSE